MLSFLKDLFFHHYMNSSKIFFQICIWQLSMTQRNPGVKKSLDNQQLRRTNSAEERKKERIEKKRSETERERGINHSLLTAAMHIVIWKYTSILGMKTKR